MNETPRSYTVEEVRSKFLDHIRLTRDYWLGLPNKTEKEKMDGLCFSILCIFDGVSDGIPALDISLCPHESDKEFNIDRGENYYEKDMVINNCQLHELWYKSQ